MRTIVCKIVDGSTFTVFSDDEADWIPTSQWFGPGNLVYASDPPTAHHIGRGGRKYYLSAYGAQFITPTDFRSWLPAEVDRIPPLVEIAIQISLAESLVPIKLPRSVTAIVRVDGNPVDEVELPIDATVYCERLIKLDKHGQRRCYLEQDGDRYFLLSWL